MNRALFAFTAVTSLAIATPAFADPPVTPSATEPEPGIGPIPFSRVPPTGAPVTMEPVALKPPEPPSDGKMGRRYLVGGIVCLGLGGILTPIGIAGVASSSSGMLSGINRVGGGVALGLGIATLLAGGITLAVGAAKANPPPPPEVSLTPTLHIGAGTAMAEWQF